MVPTPLPTRRAAPPLCLADLWSAFGFRGSPPRVAFATHVVVGAHVWATACPTKLLAATVDAAGTLTFTEQLREWPHDCFRVVTKVVRIVALPRSILPAKLTWRVGPHTGFTYELGSASW